VGASSIQLEVKGFAMRKLGVFACLIVMLFLGAPDARAKVCSQTRTVSANDNIHHSDNDTCIRVDTTSGAVTLTFDSSATFSADDEVTIKKIGTVSNNVFVSGAFEGGRAVAYLVLEGDAVTFHINSGGVWEEVSTPVAVRRGFSMCRSEHDVSTTSNVVNNGDAGFCYYLDVCSAGASIYEQLPPLSAVAYNHQNFTISFKLLNSCGSNRVASIVVGAFGDGFAGTSSSNIGLAAPGYQKIDISKDNCILRLHGTPPWWVWDDTCH
jgi:hypothetical protein